MRNKLFTAKSKQESPRREGRKGKIPLGASHRYRQNFARLTRMNRNHFLPILLLALGGLLLTARWRAPPRSDWSPNSSDASARRTRWVLTRRRRGCRGASVPPSGMKRKRPGASWWPVQNASWKGRPGTCGTAESSWSDDTLGAVYKGARWFRARCASGRCKSGTRNIDSRRGANLQRGPWAC